MANQSAVEPPKAISYRPAMSSAADRFAVDHPQDRVPLSGDPIRPAEYLREEFVDLRPAAVDEPAHAAPAAFRPATAAPVIVEPRNPEPRKIDPPPQTTISGPSFLGLTGSSASDDANYLLQDENPSRRGGWIAFALIAIAIFAAIGWLEWDTIRSGRIKIPYFSRPDTTANNASSSQPTADQPGTAATPAADSAPPKTPGENEEKLVAGDTASSASAPQNGVTSPNAIGTTQPAAAATTPANAGAPESQNPAATTTSADEKPPLSEKPALKDQPAATAQPAAKPSAKSKPSATIGAADQPEDPRQNKMLVLGEKYLYGRGVPQNCNQALVYFRAAAEQDNAPAMSHLGAMYASGQCVTMNRATAYSWFARAQNADPGNQWREKNMNMLWREMTPEERASVSH